MAFAFGLAPDANFREIAVSSRTRALLEPEAMTSERRRINWLSVSTIVSAAILIGAEVFGAAFAGSWAIATLFGLDPIFKYVLDVLLFGCGVAVMVSFLRSAQRVEPFIVGR
jgi:hypothetical protein